MRTFSIMVLGGLVTPLCWAVTGHLDQNRLVISGIEAPPSQVQSTPPHPPLRNDIVTPAPKAVERERATAQVSTQLSATDGKTNSVLAPIELPPPTTFYIAVDESPYRALSRWFHDKRIDKVAFALSAEEQDVLMRPLEKRMNFTGSLPRTITQMGEALELSLRLDVQQGVAGLHTLKGPVDVRWVKGETLKDAVASLTHSYQWQWLDSGGRTSWMSEDDYPLMGEYGLVTPRGAFDKALDIVLEDYPVQAQLISSSRTVFITERQ